jgi:hypothetical protein
MGYATGGAVIIHYPVQDGTGLGRPVCSGTRSVGRL